jgi:hypothetical protein
MKGHGTAFQLVSRSALQLVRKYHIVRNRAARPNKPRTTCNLKC